MDSLMTTGMKIKNCRLDKGLTQTELGEMVGVNKGAVNKWESGQVTNIKLSTIETLSKIFGVNPVWLMNVEGADKYIVNAPTDKIYVEPKMRDYLVKLESNKELQLLIEDIGNASENEVRMMRRLLISAKALANMSGNEE